MFQFTALPSLSLYVHFPWCVRKCPYCDFNSHAPRPGQFGPQAILGVQSGLPEAAYIDALIADLEQDLPDVWARPVRTVFMGGGTPSLFSPAAIDRLLSALRARLPLAADAEITLEANPGTVEQARFREYRAAGINRLSIGIQSFDDTLLQRLGRIHGRAEALRAAEAAHAAGFDNFNLDLMFGLPGQDLAGALADLDTALDLAPSHLSYYQLTLEPNTRFAHSPPSGLPDDDHLWAMQTGAQARLTARGYTHYEVSAYARPGQSCRHNLNYWRFGDYLGIGAGAHAKLSDARHQRIVRTSKRRGPRAYLAQAHSAARIDAQRRLTRADTGLEFMMNALRLNAGFDSALFTAHTGLPISVVEDALRRAQENAWIDRTPTCIRPTAQGHRFLNDLLGLFLPEEDH